MIGNSLDHPRILIVSRDVAILHSLDSAAKLHNWQIETAADVWEAREKIQRPDEFSLLLLDQQRDDGDGLQVLRALLHIQPALRLILIADPDGTDRRRESIFISVQDCFVKPLADYQLELAVRRHLGSAEKRLAIDLGSENIEAVGNEKFFISLSPVTQKLRGQIASLAETDVPIFVIGEPGSGKETAARLLHRLSIRSGFKFARVNCAALPEDLLEREIFGAIETKPGKLELCHYGTLFLDEITEMPLRLQGKLMQTLHRASHKSGESVKGQDLKVRLVAASSISIDQAIAERKLDAELARLFGTFGLRVPALRERKEEIPFLARHYMHCMAKRYSLPPRDFIPADIEAWQAHSWPANLRELEQAVKRYLIAGGARLNFEENPLGERDKSLGTAGAGSRNVSALTALPRQQPGGVCGYKSLKSLLQSVKEEAEKTAMTFALEKTGWNRKAAARLLKTSYRSLLYKIEQYQMNAPTTLSSFSAASRRRPEQVEFRDGHGETALIADLSRTASGR